MRDRAAQPHQPRRRMLAMGCVVIIVVGVVAWVVSASAASPERSVDRAATDSYLMAGYVYAQTALVDAPSLRVAIEGLVAKIGSECPGVLKGVPQEGAPGVPFAQHVGESKRLDEQLSELENELSREVSTAVEQSERQALLTFAGTVRLLHWSNPTVTRLVDAQASELEEQVARPIPDVCADAKAWVESGYKTLSAATKEFRAKQKVASKRAFANSGRTPNLASLLAAYEGPAEKTLIAKTGELKKERANALAGLDSVFSQLDTTLGIPHETVPTVSHPPAGAIVVGKGKTAAGGSYEVLMEPRESAGGRGSECSPQHPLNVRIVTNFREGVSGCFSPTEVVLPMVNCDEGLLTIEARTLGAVHSVRLGLSNGQQITSRVAIVPAQLGGPLGFYYQAVRGPTPIPVSLTELDERGRTLRVLKLHRFVGCTKHLLKFLPGGIRTLVHGRVPQGPAFSIEGEAYSFLGQIYFALKVEVTGGAGSGESLSGQAPNLFSRAVRAGCETHPHAILYGVLKRPKDAVLARISGTLRPLRRVAIPAHLHAGGVLVYIASSTVPSELLVRDPSGRPIVTEKLGRLSKEALETCRGEAEGAAG